ncbi:cell wall-binding protein [Pectobacterium versatile]|uniref:cell wall-binding protein n=1 Tax=Pectobacterium versatile TaxID=2488639 RepID=UPI001F4117B9|nr:cell wall-binding protein [Pectobacterium versatile]
MKKYTFVAAVIISSFLLAGCDSEPSEQDMFNALNQSIESGNSAVRAVNPDVSQAMLRKLNSVKKIDCAKESDKSYKCNAEISINNQNRTTPVRLLKTDDGWKVIGN